MPENKKPKCVYCKKGIRAYKTWDDWDKRKSHYSCWKRAEEEYRFDEQYKEFLQNQTKQNTH